ncbi:phosphatidylserine decarboxylase [Caminibacter mediatlanticus TB-2]|uniref:phosphatidylserine decarboxylase n=1 Tax=Caminibacter mediatlanticus TB-2 TaxID=391592 RepID=A0ABX5V5Y5_9BACT|nr:phosphatidylserine decarboxylase [Caminibacter mediatlanticus]QCT93688.1 phosphatidylserine decarboxylase [Caminibacter mediatlanticus TB-2]
MNPSRLLSKIVIKIAHTPFPKPIQCLINKLYVKIYEIDMSEYIPEDPCEYKTLNELFIRQKKYIEFYEDEDIVVSPSDSEIIADGEIEEGYVYQIKGKKYKIEELIPYETKLNGGYFINLYLSPKDYHRFHVPIDLEIVKATYIPGELMPVKPSFLEKEIVFPKNKRIVLRCKDKKDRYFYFVAVGAMIVGKIYLNFDERLQKDYNEITTFEYKEPIKLKKGDELGRFEFGSSILLFFGPEHFKYLNQKEFVEVGDILGEIY